MTRPYVNWSIDELEDEFDRAHRSDDNQRLGRLQHELSYRKTPRAKELRRTIEALQGESNNKTQNAAGRLQRTPRDFKGFSGKQARSHKPTDEQTAAIDSFRTGSSLKINAYAGTGKTSTLEMLAHSVGGRGQYIAFNRSIVNEAKQKFPRTVNCSTSHGMAFAATDARYKRNIDKMTGKINANQLAELLNLGKWRVDDKHLLQPRSLGFLILETIRRFAQSADPEPLVSHVPIHGSLRGAPVDTLAAVAEYAVGGAEHVWKRMLDPDDPIPLGHDGYLKLWSLSEPVIPADFILLDEAQDTNPAVLSVLENQHSQMVYVGDKYQQIYEWRGAINAMDRVKCDRSEYLTKSFRFGEAIADLASCILEKMDEPRRLTGNARMKSHVGPCNARAVLARTNAATISAVIEALDAGKRPHLVGGNNELMAMLQAVQDLRSGLPSALPEFFGFANWSDVVEFARSGEGPQLLTFVNLVEARGERQLMWALSKTVDEESSDVIVSTAHKSKGREWPTVRLEEDFESALQKRDGGPTEAPLNGGFDPAELRLLYVAVTRGQNAVDISTALTATIVSAKRFSAFDPVNELRSDRSHRSQNQAPFGSALRPEVGSSTPKIPESQESAKSSPGSGSSRKSGGILGWLRRPR